MIIIVIVIVIIKLIFVPKKKNLFYLELINEAT